MGKIVFLTEQLKVLGAGHEQLLMMQSTRSVHFYRKLMVELNIFFIKTLFLTIYFMVQTRTQRIQYSQFAIEMYTSGTLHPRQLFMPRSEDF